VDEVKKINNSYQEFPLAIKWIAGYHIVSGFLILIIAVLISSFLTSKNTGEGELIYYLLTALLIVLGIIGIVSGVELLNRNKLAWYVIFVWNISNLIFFSPLALIIVMKLYEYRKLFFQEEKNHEQYQTQAKNF